MTVLMVRPEKLADQAGIAQLLTAAFGKTDEAELVDRLRLTEDYLPELTFVAEKNNELVGFIMLSYVTLAGSTSRKVLSMGPVAVDPNHQKHGVGATMIHKSIELAEARLEPLIILLGHIEYYPRFGFERASQFGIFPPTDWHNENFMVKRLTQYSPALTGTIQYSPAWQI